MARCAECDAGVGANTPGGRGLSCVSMFSPDSCGCWLWRIFPCTQNTVKDAAVLLKRRILHRMIAIAFGYFWMQWKVDQVLQVILFSSFFVIPQVATGLHCLLSGFRSSMLTMLRLSLCFSSPRARSLQRLLVSGSWSRWQVPRFPRRHWSFIGQVVFTSIFAKFW